MSTSQPRTTSERSDDIPLIIYWLLQLKWHEVIDDALPAPHGNRQGLSYGQLGVVLLSYMMTQADHRLCAVEDWVKQHHQTLSRATGWTLGLKDASDDRLASLLEVIGEKVESREQMEEQLGQRMIRAYELPTEVARCDTSSFSVYHQIEEENESKSLLRFGHSKNRRPDLRQYRQLLGTIDPAGVPLVSETLAGNGADDPVYLPTWQRLVKVIGHKDFIYIADCKAAAHQTRAELAQAGGRYCFPLPMTGHTPSLLKSWVLNPPTPWQELRLPNSAESEPAMGVGFEMELGKIEYDSDTEKSFHWLERYLVVRSHALAQRQQKSLQQRLDKAEQALSKLTGLPHQDHCALQTKVQSILKRYRVKDYFLTEIDSETVTRYAGPGRPSHKDTNRTIVSTQFQLKFERQGEAIAIAEQLTGWRIYVTNVRVEQLSLTQAVIYYRDQWQLEHGFHRFKRGQLPALPIYLANEDRIIGLMFLLTIALRCFTLIEFQVRRELQTQQDEIAGLYAGNPKRKTQRPTTERLLKAFENITLYHHRDGTCEITPLNDLQRRILQLMKLPDSIYELPVST
ncbi:MAG: IS1634 family transposase [Prochloraceae cyanobacterium]